MSTSTATRNVHWRQRVAEKERLQKEAALRAIELEQQKLYENTESNFPSTLPKVNHMTVRDGPAMAEKILEAHIQAEVRKQMEAYHNAANARQRRDIVNGVYIFRRNRNLADVDGEYYEDEPEKPKTLSEQFPSHGKRGFCTEPDSEGWRLVIKRTRRKQTRALTNAELERKYRDEILGEEDEEDIDQHGDLTERAQRRDFY